MVECISGRTIAKHSNGTMTKRELSLARKRRWSLNSDEEDEGVDDYYGTHVSEERYRQMLGEHIKKYKRRSKDSSSPMPTRMGNSVPKGNSSLKARKSGSEQQGGFLEVETANEWLNDVNPHRPGSHRDADFTPRRTPDRFSSLNDYLKSEKPFSCEYHIKIYLLLQSYI